MFLSYPLLSWRVERKINWTKIDVNWNPFFKRISIESKLTSMDILKMIQYYSYPGPSNLPAWRDPWNVGGAYPNQDPTHTHTHTHMYIYIIYLFNLLIYWYMYLNILFIRICCNVNIDLKRQNRCISWTCQTEVYSVPQDTTPKKKIK